MSFDFTVLGGGPAGLVSATLAARQGYRVALLAPKTEGALKVGESVPAATNRLLQQLDLPLLTTSDHSIIPGSESLWAGFLEHQDALLYQQGCDWRLNRPVFETQLADIARQAGVSFFEGRLLHLTKEDSQWYLECDTVPAFHTSFLIDASGRSAVLSRLLTVPKEKGEPLVALWACPALHNQLESETLQNLPRQTLIESQADGWWYAARLPNDTLMAIFHTSATLAATLRKRPEGWLQHLQSTQLISKRLPTTLFNTTPIQANNARDVRLLTPYGDQWAACGDAALSFDPLSSQGIYNALASAAMLHKALQSSDRHTALKEYGEKLFQVAGVYQQKRQQFYRQASDYYQSDFWQSHIHSQTGFELA